ncbi:unnamed protein product [Tilletia caries]|nr:unnamed protein product [Tilletia caries]
MPPMTGLFAGFSTLHLRTFLVASQPGKRASRMTREQLSQLLLDSMVADEVTFYERAARTTFSDITNIDQYANTVHRKLDERYGSYLPVYLPSLERRRHPLLRSTQTLVVTHPIAPTVEDVSQAVGESSGCSSWPQPIPDDVKHNCMLTFAHETNIKVAATCAVCGRRTFSRDLLFTDHWPCKSFDPRLLSLDILRITDPHILERPTHYFTYGDPCIDGLALHKDGIHVLDGTTSIDICGQCHRDLVRVPPRVPALSLANDNIRGFLPADLQDVTWLEERLCARYLSSAYIVRLYDLTAPGAVDERPRIMKGHACAFPLNTVSTAIKLPWAIVKQSPLISCIVIGPRQPRIKDLRNVFKIRREKVRSLLMFLREHSKGYPQFPLDENALAMLPEDDVPELIMRHVLHETHDDAASLFAQETAGLDKHPGLLDEMDDDMDNPRSFLEHHGLLDLNGMAIPHHSRMMSAVANATGTERPDLVIRHGTTFVQEYNNPELFPGMFPTLFPWGTGGFEMKRRTALSFQRQAKYLLDLTEPAFRRHWSFIFVVAYIKQRRAIHNGSRFMCRAQDFVQLSNMMQTLTPSLVKRISDHLQHGGSLNTLIGDERRIFALIKKCQVVSAHVPGSRAIMIRARADIRAYVGHHGIFHLFLTLNPGPSHSPVFQIFYGDKTVNLDIKAPSVPTSQNRGIRVADDPVAASDYFHFHIAAVFQYLLGWDLKRAHSTVDGGLFGRLSAYYLVKEHSMRGQLHCHCLIWSDGGLNPSVLRSRMHSDEEFRQRYLDFVDDLLSHGYPHSENAKQEPPPATTRKPRQERPPRPSDDGYPAEFHEDHHLLSHEVQMHRHTFTCFKGGRTSCRFLYPHEIVSRSSFDTDTNSINVRVQHPLINWHNPHLLVATRHNHDLKSIQSGKSGSAAASYITSYTTKSEETPANQISMINAVYERMATQGTITPDAKAFLTRCVMQFGRERQVHAQQAATYVRDLGDTEQSHATVSMMSGQLVSTVISLFGRVRDLNGTDDNIHPNGNPEPIPTPRQGHAGYEDGDAAHNAEMEIDDPQPSGLHTEDDEEDDGFDDDDMLPLNTKGLAYQVDDYLHRGATLATLTFFQFVQYVKLDTPPKNRNKNHHDLAETHPNFPRYIHRYTPNHSHGIPRCITSRFPRSDGTKSHGDQYCAAMMAHFVPFSNTVALKNKTETWESAFQQITFSERAIATMSNWAALNECEDARDARDADQLLRRRREANHSGKLDQQVRMVGTEPVDDSMADVNVEALLHSRSDQSGETLKYVSVLDSNGWFQTATAAHGGVVTAPARALVPVVNRKVWKKEQDVLEAKARADLMVPTASTVIYQHARRNASTGETFSPNALLDELVRERNLTPSQRLAFCIAGRRFFDVMHGNSVEPLRMLMHGEAGTGKTVVVRLLRELMDRFGHGNAIKFLAPTGKAASAIGGQTQHSAFGLDVHRRGLTTDETQATRTANHAKRLQFLQKAFGTVRWLFFDEVSLTSCEVFTEIDQSLRIATQRLDEPFGGVNVIFAGDLCQLPPVGAAPLYTRTSRSSLSGDIRTKIELGRLSWLSINSVVEFTEQMRMKDTDMASALARLRLRQCTDADARLLNTNVLRLPPSVTNVDLKTKRDLVVLAATNQTVRSLNERKAASQASVQSQDLVISHAIDDTSAVLELSSRNALLNYNGRGDTKVGMGRLPLFVGMPIIYRGPNQSIPLGVTNGAFGRVVNWKMSTDRLGFTIPKVAIIRFDENASWQLSGLEPGCLPIYPCASSFSFSLAHGENSVHRISRQQLPLQPGFAMTVHSAQGITCHGGVVVDLCRGGFPAYVSASRATRRQDIHLIGEIEGDTCTRVCRFFSVKTSRAPAALDPHESTSTAEAVARWVFAYILTTETTSPTADPPKSHSISTSSPPSAKRTRDGLSSFPSAGKKVVIEIQEPDVENPLDQRRMFARAHRLRRARSTTPVIQARLLCERDTTEQTFGRNAALSQVLGALIKTVYGAFFATLDCQTAGLIRSPSRRWSALYYDRSIPLSWTRKADTWITVSTFE